MIAFIRRHPAASYFVLAFAISWTGVLAVVAPGPIPAPPAEVEQLFVFVYLAMLAGPPIAGIAMTAIVSGANGLRDFRKRLLEWRVELRWYAVALFTAPLVILATVLALSRLSADFNPVVLTDSHDPTGPIRATSRSAFVVTGLLVGLGAGFFEELGWTGYATPALHKRLRVLSAALIIGVLWGAWHFLAIWWGSASSFGMLPVPIYLLVALFSFLLPYRVLMAWLYDRTRSLLVAILMHASLTASMLILGPAVAGGQVVVYDLTFAAALWTVVGLVISRKRQQALLLAGIASTILYAAADVIGGLRYEGYSFWAQGLSELMAIGAPSAPEVNAMMLVYDALVIAFGVGVLRAAGSGRRALFIVGMLLVAYGVAGALGPTIFRMHPRGSDLLVDDTPHIVLTASIVVLMILAMAYGSMALDRRFRATSLTALALTVASGAWSGVYGLAIAANQSTPGFGVVERVAVYTPMVWLAMLASRLLRYGTTIPLTGRVLSARVAA